MVTTGRFVVIACSKCRTPWATETRFETARCSRCGTAYKVRERKAFWTGDDAREAQVAVGLVAEQEAKRAR